MENLNTFYTYLHSLDERGISYVAGRTVDPTRFRHFIQCHDPVAFFELSKINTWKDVGIIQDEKPFLDTDRHLCFESDGVEVTGVFTRKDAEMVGEMMVQDTINERDRHNDWE